MIKLTLYITILSTVIISCNSKKTLSHNSENKISQKKENEFASNFIEATTQKIIGNYEKSEQLFLAGLKIKPASAASYFELSGIYDYKKNGQEAISKAEKSVELNPKNYWYKTNLAVLYQKNGLYNKSLPLYKELAENNPEKQEYLFLLAENYLIINKNEEAIKIYTKIQEKLGNTEELAQQKQSIYVKLGQIDNAIKEIENLIKDNPNVASYYGVLAELYEEKGDSNKALELYNTVLKLDPNNENIRFALYGFYKEKGNSEKAFYELKKAFEAPNTPIDKKIKIIFGYLNSKDKTTQKNSTTLAKAILKAHPTNPRSHTIMAEVYKQKKDIQNTLKAYKKSVELYPDQRLIWEQIVFLEADMELYDSLIIDSKKAIELYPTQPVYYFFSGLGNLKKDNYNKAIEKLNLGKDLVINNKKMLSEFFQKIGDAYRLKKDYELSDKNYDKALEIAPNNHILLNNYSYYLADRGEKLNKAEQMIKLANNMISNNINYIDTYAWILFKQKKYNEAEQKLLKTLNIGGEESAVILEHYGDINYFLNKTKTAVEYWKKAKKINQNSKILEEKIRTEKYIKN